MSNYGKLKNDELRSLLRERGLPATGKKADVVERLTKDDEKKATEAAPAQSNAHPEDKIDWDDEDAVADAGKGTASATKDEKGEKTGTSVPASAGVAESDTVAKAGSIGQPPNPIAVPNQQAAMDPSKTDDLSVKRPGGEKAEEPEEPAPSYKAIHSTINYK